jgi:hypothetical protein
MKPIHLLVALSLPFVSVAGAQTQIANFDSAPEGVVGLSFVEDGLLFDEIDSYTSSGNVLPFVVEDASGTFSSGKKGFGPPNLLKFGSFSAGPNISSLGRFGSFTITPGGVRRSAVVNLVMLPSFGTNQITLEASLGGFVVAADSVPVPGGNWTTAVLALSGVDFDKLKLFSSGTGDGGASFVAFDSIVVEASGPGTSYCVTSPNSVGPGASISAEGSKSVHANNLVLNAGAVPNTPGLYFFGPSSTQLPFGNGTLCVGGPLLRLAGHVAVNNTLTHTLDVQQPTSGTAPILPGSTHRFQAWYRDPAAGGAGFNLSDGLEVTFTP